MASSTVDYNLPTLDYNSLLGLPSVEEVIKFITHVDTLNSNPNTWQDLIQRKYGLQVEKATQEDYRILWIYASNNKGSQLVDKEDLYPIGSLQEDILRQLVDDDKIEELRAPIKESLRKVEGERGSYSYHWLPNSNTYSLGEAEGYYTRATSAEGAALNFMEKFPGFEDTLFELYRDSHYELNNISEARTLMKASRVVRDLLMRSKNTQESNLPSIEELDEIYAEKEKNSHLEDIDKYINGFYDFLEGELEEYSRPIFNSYREIKGHI